MSTSDRLPLPPEDGAAAFTARGSRGNPAVTAPHVLVADVLESTSDAFLAVDADLRITYFNARAASMLDRRSEDVVGRGLWDVFPHPASDPFRQRCERVVAAGQPADFDTVHAASGAEVEVRSYPLRDGGVAAYFRDVAASRRAERERERLLASEREARSAAEQAHERLEHLVSHDEVTGLLNRSGLLRHVAGRAREDGAESLTVLCVDLDHFKRINDTLGHGAGDEVLEAVGRRLREAVRDHDAVARLGGDEFLVALFAVSQHEATTVARRILEALREPHLLEGHLLSVAASIGMSRREVGEVSLLHPDHEWGALVREADTALYAAKDAGRGCVAWYDEDLRTRTEDRVRTEAELRGALDRDELFLDFQPAFSLATGATVDVEALLRWQHPDRGLLAPGEFIAVAEETGLIVPIGDRVIAMAAAQAARWAELPGVRVWVNISPAQLASPGLADRILRALARAGVPTCRFGVEVTESTLAEVSLLRRELQAVHDAGIAIAIDDFGTGFSSLARLTRMPVDVIKIDRSFTSQAGTAMGDALLNTIITLAHAVGAQVIAEGVETEQQLQRLVDLGCDNASGYLLSRPAAAARLPGQLGDALGVFLRSAAAPTQHPRARREGTARTSTRLERAGLAGVAGPASDPRWHPTETVGAPPPGQRALRRWDAARLAALDRYRLLDRPSKPELDRIANVASRTFGSSYTALSVLDAEHQYTLAGVGTTLGRNVTFEQALCHLVVESGSILSAEDLAADPVLAEFPAHQLAGFRFYMTAPITTADGHTIGSLCVADTRSRQVSPEDEQALTDLAALAMFVFDQELHTRRGPLAAVAG